MKQIKWIVTVISILAGIATIIGIIPQFLKESPTLEVVTISNEELTKTPTVDDLQATYTYKNQNVKSLRRLHFFIRNDGSSAIIGEGPKKHIIKDGLTFKIGSNFLILESDFKFDNDFGEIESEENQFVVRFLQWKAQEALEGTLYLEVTSPGDSPTIELNEREIVNGRVKQVSIVQKKEELQKRSFFDRLPNYLRRIFTVFGSIFYISTLVGIPIGLIWTMAKNNKYRRWFKKEATVYRNWISTLVEKKELEDYVDPEKLPRKLWKDYPGTKPEVPTTKVVDLFFGLALFWLLAAIPMALLIKY